MKTHRILLALFGSLCAAAFVHADATLAHRYLFDGDLNDFAGTINGTVSPDDTYNEAPTYAIGTPTGAVGPTGSLHVGGASGTDTKRSGFSLDSAAYSSSGSISLWVQYDLAASTDSQADYIFNQGGVWNTGLKLFVRDNNTNQLRFSVGDTTIGTYTAGLTQDTWYHVAVTWDATTGSAALYVNGTLIGSSTSVVGTKFATTGLNVGSWSFSSGTGPTTQVNQFHGSIYDMQIYDGQLDATQIAQLAASPGSAIVIPEPAAFTAVAGALMLGAVGLRRRRRR